MLFIIFGTRVRHQKIDEGDFFCPHCNQPRHYEHKRARRFFALYFIPIIPLDSVGEFVECTACKTTFNTAVLNYRPTPAKPQKADLARMMNNVELILKQGTPVEYLIRDLTSAGLDREVAKSTVNTYLKGGQKVCDSCGLTYHPSVKTCASCGKNL